ncbi:MAG: alpha-amylase family protein [Bacteroidales bacterium]|nr:alpha-amylase family protein [Bacteroidales bacterium]
MSKIILYQIFTRLFGNKNKTLRYDGTLAENGVGKMNDISKKALNEIRQLGVTDIWYTGILEHATTTDYPNIPANHPDIVKGKAGSPYAIRDYYDIDPDIAENPDKRMEEFEQLVQRTHNAGLRVWIDFVPNHVSRDYHSDVFPNLDFGKNDDTTCSFSPQNNFYYLPQTSLQLPINQEYDSRFKESPAKVTGNDCFSAYPTENDWYETVKLNYGIDIQNGNVKHFVPIPDTWTKMLNILQFWCKKGVDGFRCDMAEMVPVEFWHWAISSIKQQFPSVKFIAEIYQPNLYQEFITFGQFDFLYDKVGLYDTLRSIIEEKMTADNISNCWKSLNGMDDKMLRFLENHDEQRIVSKYFAGNSINSLNAMILTATMNVGPVMIYFGQEVGEEAVGESGFSGDDGRTTIFDYWTVPEHQKWMNEGKFDGGQLSVNQKELRTFYHDLFQLSQYNSVANGAFYDLLWANNLPQNIYAYLRYTKTEFLLFILNFDQQEQTGTVKIPQHALNKMQITTNDVHLQPIFGVGAEQLLSNQLMTDVGISFKLKEYQFVVFTINSKKITS